MEKVVVEGKELDQRVRSLLGAGRSDEAATETLQGVGPEILGYLGAMMSSESDADEVFGAVGERVWKGLPGFEWRCSLRSWVYLSAVTTTRVQRRSEEQPVLRRDLTRDQLGDHRVPVRSHPRGSGRVDGRFEIEPPQEPTRVTRPLVVATGQERHPRLLLEDVIEDRVRQRTACVRRHDDILGSELHVRDGTLLERYPPREPRPDARHRGAQRLGARRQPRIDGVRSRRAVVEDQHQPRHEPVAARQIDDASSAKPPPRTPRDLPGLEELASR